MTQKKGPGRPKANIDWKYVDQLLQAGCTGTEIAASIGINEDTLYKRCELEKNMGFSAYLHIKRSSGNALLRAKQFSRAMKGSDRMMIWLGKQRLDQSDVITNNTHLDGHLVHDFESKTDEELEVFIKANIEDLADEEGNTGE